MLDTTNTIGHMVPGPTEKRLAVNPAIEPIHNAVVRICRDPDLEHPTSTASAKSTATVDATARPEFSHHPPLAWRDAALKAPVSSGTSVSNGFEMFIMGSPSAPESSRGCDPRAAPSRNKKRVRHRDQERVSCQCPRLFPMRSSESIGIDANPVLSES